MVDFHGCSIVMFDCQRVGEFLGKEGPQSRLHSLALRASGGRSLRALRWRHQREGGSPGGHIPAGSFFEKGREPGPLSIKIGQT